MTVTPTKTRAQRSAKVGYSKKGRISLGIGDDIAHVHRPLGFHH